MDVRFYIKIHTNYLPRFYKEQQECFRKFSGYLNSTRSLKETQPNIQVQLHMEWRLENGDFKVKDRRAQDG